MTDARLTRWQKFWCLASVAMFPIVLAAGGYEQHGFSAGELVLWCIGAGIVLTILAWERHRYGP